MWSSGSSCCCRPRTDGNLWVGNVLLSKLSTEAGLQTRKPQFRGGGRGPSSEGLEIGAALCLCLRRGGHETNSKGHMTGTEYHWETALRAHAPSVCRPNSSTNTGGGTRVPAPSSSDLQMWDVGGSWGVSSPEQRRQGRCSTVRRTHKHTLTQSTNVCACCPHHLPTAKERER